MTEAKPHKTTIITDPVHQVLNLGSDSRSRKAFKDVVDTPSFQRLRRITQLGLASYVFPGALHSRFLHSLGVIYLAHTVLRHLRERAAQEDESEVAQLNELELEVKICALLHDVGHGPFSHSFENVLKSIAEIKDPPLHEDWTAAIITGEQSDIRRALVNNGLNVNRIASAFTKGGDEKFPQYLKPIVSSQLDVDRMDYLVRDSHFVGVAVGKFDLHYLINSLVVVRHGKPGPKTLGLTPKGVKAYEGFVLARQLMNKTVYYHRKVKVLEFMMEQFIREVLRNYDAITAIQEMSGLMPDYFTAVAKLMKNGKAYDKEQFLTDNLASYVALTEDSVWSLLSAIARKEMRSKEASNLQRLARMLLTREVLSHYAIQSGKEVLLEAQLKTAGFIKDKDFSITQVKTTMYKAADEDKVFVVDWDGRIAEISAHSETILALRDKPEMEALLIVIDADKQEEIERAAIDMDALDASLTDSISKREAEVQSAHVPE